MKKIKSLSLALAALVAFGFLAEVRAAKSPNNAEVPLNQKGEEAFPENAGWLFKRNSGTAEMLVCSGRCLLKALILNTGPLTSQVVVRNSTVEESAPTSNIAFVHRYQLANTAPGNNPVQAPMIFTNGITVKLNAVSNQEEVTVLYRDLD